MKSSILKSAKLQLKNIASDLESEYENKKRFSRALNYLKTPQKLVKGQITIKLDNGKSKKFLAIRSQHNNTRGPYKGGTRFHPQVTVNEVKALSMWMSIKCAVAGIPYGGGKGAVVVDPNELSSNELMRLCKKYAEFLAPHIGEWVDIPGPDVNTYEQTFAWMLDAYEKKIGRQAPAAFTGKPIALGGSLGRTEATGQGGVFTLLAYVKKNKLVRSKTTIAVQGFGNVGYWFSYLAQKEGFKIVAVSDSSGAIYNQKGINLDKAKELKEKYNSFKEALKYFKGGYKFLNNEELLALQVDVLAPAALENAINSNNASSIRAKVVLELANGPTTPDAEEILLANKVVVVPDVLANAGGVTVSYFEWVQNLHGYKWTKERVNGELEKKITSAFNDVYEIVKVKKVSYRKAAYILAVKRIIDAMYLRGIV